MDAVHLEQLHHSYRKGKEAIGVLEGIDLDVAHGEHLALLGPSGSGKTTLLSIMGGLERPQRGTVRVCGEDLSRLSGDELAAFRARTVGFVFQHFGLLEALSALENVELALVLAGVLPARERAARARDLLGRVGLAHRLGHRPAELSGGERQRVAIARAIANKPRLILADEPTGNLDDDSSQLVGDLLESLCRQEPCTLVVVTHHQELAERADRVLRLSAGRLVRTPLEVQGEAGSR